MPKLNRHARKRQHKRELMRRHAIASKTYDVEADKDECKRLHEEYKGSKWDDARNDGYNYWDTFYISGPKRFAKYCTNRRIRSMYKSMIANELLSEIVAPHGADYEKLFDFWWTVF